MAQTLIATFPPLLKREQFQISSGINVVVWQNFNCQISGVAPENGRGLVQNYFFKKRKSNLSRKTYPKDILKVLAKNSKKCRRRYIFAYAD